MRISQTSTKGWCYIVPYVDKLTTEISESVLVTMAGSNWVDGTTYQICSKIKMQKVGRSEKSGKNTFTYAIQRGYTGS